MLAPWEDDSSKVRSQSCHKEKKHQHPTANGAAGVALGFICRFCKCLEKQKNVSKFHLL